MKCLSQLPSSGTLIFVKPGTVACAVQNKVKAELNDLVRVSIISKVEKVIGDHPLFQYCSQVGKILICAYYKRTLNSQLVDVYYPIPLITEKVNQLSESKYYCKLDLCKAYSHLEVNEHSSIAQTIFTHVGELFKMNRRNQGLKTASAFSKTKLFKVPWALYRTLTIL